MMKKRMLGVIAVLLVCIFALSACKKEAGKPVDNAVSENITDDPYTPNHLLYSH